MYLISAERKDERQEEVAELMVKVKRLTEQRDELQGQITQIDDVTKDKDSYFNSLNERIKQSEQVYVLCYQQYSSNSI